MKLIELCEQYLNGDITALSLIRTVSGAFPPKMAVDLLVLICAITRVEDGDLDKETFQSIYLNSGKVP